MKPSSLKLISTIAIFTIPLLANASPEGGPITVPWEMIGKQVLNLGLVIFGLTYFLKKPVGAYFQNRYDEFNKMIREAEEAKSKAEKEKRIISEKLKALEEEKDSTLSRAKSEAQVTKTKLLKEADELAEKIKTDAQSSLSFELERAKAGLRKQLLEKSIGKAKTELKTNISEAADQKLNEHFVAELQVSS